MIKYKILANKKQLENLGIDYEITGLIGELIHKYTSNWYVIKVSHKIQDIEFVNEFDIPKSFLKLIEE